MRRITPVRLLIVFSILLLLAAIYLRREWASGPVQPPVDVRLTSLELETQLAPKTKRADKERPLSFIRNDGQLEPGVVFHVNSAGHAVLFESGGIVLRRTAEIADGNLTRSEISIRFENAALRPSLLPLGQLPGVANFYRGNDPTNWQTGIETYDGVRYEGLYDGIDLVYNGAAGVLKREFIVAPGVNPGTIRMKYDGVDALYIRRDGVLVVETPFGRLTESAPFVYQTIGGERQPVAGSFEQFADRSIGFEIGPYDHSFPLIIDPELTFASYFGGSGFDNISSINTNSDGHIFIGGVTNSANFPLVNEHQGALGGGFLDMFVSRIDPGTGTVLYSTFLGGDQTESLVELRIDADDNAYIFGRTSATDFPTLNAVQDAVAGSVDAVAAKFAPDGTLLFSTFLGGDGDDRAGGMDLDADGNIWMTGRTSSTDFPTTVDAISPVPLGDVDAYVTELAGDGSAIIYSSYLGGIGDDRGEGLTVDGVGDVFLSGSTTSTEFTGVPSAGSSAAFVAKLHNDGVNPPSVSGVCTADGTSSDAATEVAVDGFYAFFGGSAGANLPVTSGAHQSAYGGGGDGMIGACLKETMEISYLSYDGDSDFNYISGLALTTSIAGKDASLLYNVRLIIARVASALETSAKVLELHLEGKSDGGSELESSGFFDELLDGLLEVQKLFMPSYQHVMGVGTTDQNLPTTPDAISQSISGGFDGYIFSILRELPGSVTGNVYFDVDGNGVRDDQDFPFNNIVVELRQDGILSNEAASDTSGHYLFFGVDAGDYTLTQRGYPGLTTTLPVGGSYDVMVESGTEHGPFDFLVQGPMDFGDLPDPREDLINDCPIGGPLSCYRTIRSVLGAAHVVFETSIILGERIDADADGQPTTLADGDDLNVSSVGGEDDEDGLQSFTVLPTGAFEVTVMVRDFGNEGGILDVFVDLNDDGVLNDGSVPGGSREHVISSAVVNGINTIESPPGVIQTGDVLEYMRLRISSQGTPFAWGAATDGEVEDYHRSAIQTAIESGRGTAIPESYALFQNYPNPFNGATVIQFDLPEREKVSLTLYDVLGREVRTLYNGVLSPGRQNFSFEADGLTSGVYLYTLKTESYSKTNQMLLLK